MLLEACTVYADELWCGHVVTSPLLCLECSLPDDQDICQRSNASWFYLVQQQILGRVLFLKALKLVKSDASATLKCVLVREYKNNILGLFLGPILKHTVYVL